MKKHTNPNPDSTHLRRKAEDLLKMKKAEKVTLLAESDALKLVHELQVYQIELEMQNEELALAKKQADDLAAEKYNELYDFAPTGYFTLSKEGKIVKLNFRGADMLGKERSRLIGNPVSFFVSDDTKLVFSDFLNRVFNSDYRESCVVTLQILGNNPVYVQLSGICYDSRDECLVTATDITGRVKAEELLKQNEAVLTRQNELFSSLLKNLQTGVFMVEAPTGKPLMANEKALELLGRGILPDANKHNLAEVYKAFKADSRQPYPPEEMPVLLGINGQSAQIDDMIVVRPDGTEILLEIFGTPVKDKKGNVWASLVSFMDITERKKAEQALQAERENFFAVFESSPVAMLVVDETTNIILVNLAAITLGGGTKSDYLQHRPGNALRCVHSSNDPRGCGYASNCRLCKLRNGIEALIANGGELSGAEVEMELFRNEEPHKVWLNIGIEPMLYSGSRHWCIALNDISERKKAEAAIRLSEEKFRGIFDQASVGAAIVDMEKRFVRCNPAFCNFLGYSEEELIGKLISDVTFPEDVFLGQPELKQIVKMEIESAILEKRYLRKDGSVVWGEIRLSLVRDEKNSPIFFLPIIQDITNRKRVEEALKESEKHFRELADSITDVFFEMDTDLRYTYWNKASENLLGIAAESAIGKSIHEIFPDTPDIAIAEAVYRGVIQTRQSHIFESVFEYNGKRIIFEIRVYPTERGISVFTTDITGRKRAEAEIKLKNEELLKTNAEKDKFFSILAHDLRSPFNAFLGLTQMMEEELPVLTLDEIKSYAVSMRKSANMLFHLLETLLEWSRMQRGLISYKPETVHLSNEISAGIELVRDAASKKLIEIRQNIPDTLFIKADAPMFESVMRNLMFNAIKFTPPNGEITLAAKKISDTMVQISVSDTGIGMDKHLINKLFQLDEQTHRKGTEGEPSTGLGLIICKDFVEKHGGAIWAESNVGKGSTFYFTIPSENELKENSRLTSIPPTYETLIHGKKLKVLIVEDDEISRMLISAALKPYSRELLITRTGTETVEIARNNPDIDLILMDIQLPEMDGYEATRRIRGFNTDVIIIAQTAFGLSSDIEKSMEAGCNDHVSKPLNLILLRSLIKKYFNK
ncbi:MAG: PAS domain S-box protein [Bacteroidales bacterium]|nr:PAS domain S-box protein [Bacteroidales bacterium]